MTVFHLGQSSNVGDLNVYMYVRYNCHMSTRVLWYSGDIFLLSWTFFMNKDCIISVVVSSAVH